MTEHIGIVPGDSHVGSPAPGALVAPGFLLSGGRAVSRPIAFLVDGFNLYHSLRAAEHHWMKAGAMAPRGARWLDLMGLCRSLAAELADPVVGVEVTYFTALANHLQATDPEIRNRHLRYIRCLESTGVKCVLSRFKRQDVRCAHCGRRTPRYQEKETDVAIGVRMLELLQRQDADDVVIFSGDSDLAPALTAARRMFPRGRTHIALPFGRVSNELRSVAHGAFVVRHDDYAQHRLPEPFILPNGKAVECPVGW